MKKVFIVLLMMLSFSTLKAQDETKSMLYKGNINGTIPVTMFLISYPNDCLGTTDYMGMYKYDKQNKWIQVYVRDNDKNQFIMTEIPYTGTLMMELKSNQYEGLWISPDTKKQLKIILKETPMKSKEKDELRRALDEVNYFNHDC